MSEREITIWQRYQSRLRSFAYRHTHDGALADDIIQDVFLKVYSRMGELKEPDKLPGWLYQVTRNVMVDHYRKKRKASLLPEDRWESEYQPLNDCVISCLQDMVKDMPEKYRTALEQAELQNKSQLEMAQELGMSYSGLKSRVQRAREMLKKKMDAAYSIKFDSYGNVLHCQGRASCGCP